MSKALTQQAREVLSLAADEARRLGHQYVGTEHVLLALTTETSFVASGVPARLGLNRDDVRKRVESLVQPDPRLQVSNDPAKVPPLTPRANRAIQLASEEAATVSLALAGPEHLLIGLIREPSGVAGVVLRELSLDEARVRSECLHVRLRQMQVVERAVRPVQATAGRKRHMREELLAHLTAVCEQEQQDGAADALAALDAAAKRFGDPAELARELQASVPRMERFNWHVERWLGWRAPETVLRMLLRSSLISFAFITICAIVSIAAGFLVSSDGPDAARVLRVFAPLALLTPAAQFGFGWCYFKARDALWGAFGTRRSFSRANAWSVAAGVVVFLCGLGFVLGVEGPSSSLMTVRIPSLLAAGVVAAALCALLAWTRGPAEIRDTTWSLLPVESAC